MQGIAGTAVWHVREGPKSHSHVFSYAGCGIEAVCLLFNSMKTGGGDGIASHPTGASAL